jgi:hypothetical protein
MLKRFPAVGTGGRAGARRRLSEFRHIRQPPPLAVAFGLQLGFGIDAALGDPLADLLRADRPVFHLIGSDDFVVRHIGSGLIGFHLTCHIEPD